MTDKNEAPELYGPNHCNQCKYSESLCGKCHKLMITQYTRADLSDAKGNGLLGPQSPEEERVFEYERRIVDLEIEVNKRDKRIAELEAELAKALSVACAAEGLMCDPSWGVTHEGYMKLRAALAELKGAS